MNRIPNYRVWHKIEKRFVELRTIDFVAENIGYDSEGEFNYWEIEPFDNIVFQQFTGLYDRDRKEIYEGDILEIQKFEKDNFDKKYIQNGVVEFSTGSFLFTPLEKDNDSYYTFISFRELFKYSKNHLAYCAPKIIGNTFENPELLK
jgi:uncharacterized phage protein (TIGR01671 family)